MKEEETIKLISQTKNAIKAIATAAQEKDENLSFFTVLVSGQGNNKIAGAAGKGDVQDIVKAFVQVLNVRKQMRSMLMSELIASIKKEALELVDDLEARGLHDEEVQHLIEGIDDAGLDVIKMAILDMKNDQSNTNEKGDRWLCTGLNDAAKQIHEDAKRKGFWDSERETGTLLMLCVSELSEALEADRKGRVANLDKFDKGIAHGDIFETYIKDTFEDELADTVIRILDLCGARGIDIERHINEKLKYNRSRERMHGKAY